MYPWAQTFVNVPPVFQPGKFPTLTTKVLLEERSLFNCTEKFVHEQAGPLVCLALEQIQEKYARGIELAKEHGLSAVIDVRVQRLMPEMYPSIPGWHCDAVPRDVYTGQPNFKAIDPHSFHVALLLSSEPAGVSNTEYVKAVLKPTLFSKDHVYKDLHQQIEKLKPDTVIVRDGNFVWFTPKSIHRARPVVRRGVRLFMRYSLIHSKSYANMLNPEQMVYVISEENGW